MIRSSALSRLSWLFVVAILAASIPENAFARCGVRCGPGLVTRCRQPRLLAPPQIRQGLFRRRVAFVNPRNGAFFQQPQFAQNQFANSQFTSPQFQGAGIQNQLFTPQVFQGAPVQFPGPSIAGQTFPGSVVNSSANGQVAGTSVDFTGRNIFGQLVSLVQPTGFNNLFLGSDNSLHTILGNRVANITIQTVQLADGSTGEQLTAGGFQLPVETQQQIATFYCATPDRTAQLGERVGFLASFMSRFQFPGANECAARIGTAMQAITDPNLRARDLSFVAARAPLNIQQAMLAPLGLTPGGPDGSNGPTAVPQSVHFHRVGGPNGKLKQAFDADGNLATYYGEDSQGHDEVLVFSPEKHDIVLGNSGTEPLPEVRTKLIGEYCKNLSRVAETNDRIDFLLHQVRNNWKDTKAQDDCLKALAFEVEKLPEDRKAQLEPVIVAAPAVNVDVFKSRQSLTPPPPDGYEPQLTEERMADGSIKLLGKVKAGTPKVAITDDHGKLWVDESFDLTNQDLDGSVANKLVRYLCEKIGSTIKTKENTAFLLRHLDGWAQAVKAKNPNARENCLTAYRKEVGALDEKERAAHHNWANNWSQKWPKNATLAELAQPAPTGPVDESLQVVLQNHGKPVDVAPPAPPGIQRPTAPEGKKPALLQTLTGVEARTIEQRCKSCHSGEKARGDFRVWPGPDATTKIGFVGNKSLEAMTETLKDRWEEMFDDMGSGGTAAERSQLAAYIQYCLREDMHGDAQRGCCDPIPGAANGTDGGAGQVTSYYWDKNEAVCRSITDLGTTNSSGPFKTVAECQDASKAGLCSTMH